VKRTFTIVVGPLENTPLNQLDSLVIGSIGYSEAKVVWVNPSNAGRVIVGDATGYAYIFNSTPLTLTVGDFVGLTYSVADFRGLVQMNNVIVSEAKGAEPTALLAAQVWTPELAETYATSAKINVHYVIFEDLVGFASGNFTNAYLPGFGLRTIQTTGAANTLREQQFDVTGFMLGRSSAAPANTIIIQPETFTTGITPTDSVKLAIATDRLVLPAANAELNTNLSLPTTGLYGATVAWTSSDPDVISTTGEVTRPLAGAGNKEVTLSYVITVGGVSSTSVDIAFTVLELTGVAEVVSIYTLGFEAEEGFVSSQTYNNTVEKVDGLTGFQWASIMGTATTTGKIDGTLSFQMRTYANSPLGYIYSNFNLSDVTSFTFQAKAVANTVLEVLISKDDGVTWISGQLYTLTTTATEYTYTVSETDLTGNFRIKFSIQTAASRSDLTIDNLEVFGLR
jgi:hypothetical protein